MAKILSLNNYIVGMAGRRTELLSNLQREISGSYIKRIDVTESEEAITLLKELIQEMGGMDLIIISSGVGFINPELDWKKASKSGMAITVTEIQPGFVNTAMAKGEGLFWVAPPEKAAWQILRAITGKKKHAYITKRWRSIAWLLKVIPGWIYNKL